MLDWLTTNAGMVGLVFFLTFFVLTAVWIFRPGSKKSYQDNALIPFKEQNHD